MALVRHKFDVRKDAEFFATLRKRVNNYFKENNISKHANTDMKVKTVFMLSMLAIPYFILILAPLTALWQMFALWAMMGLATAGIGLCIMHDANHGSYSKSKKVNKWLGYTLNLAGGNAEVWKLQHNVLHHTYTNIDNSDDDINTPPFLRFSPHQKRRWIHRFQHIYVWFFYGLATLSWVTAKEYFQLKKYFKMGVIPNENKHKELVRQWLGWKIVYFVYILVIPALLLPFSFGWILLGFFLMHYIAGLALSMVFQTAHIMPECEYPMPNKENTIENNWAVHQLLTTTNYSRKSRLVTWLVGGLNFQVEHHLFANICHIHYHKISSIVEDTAKEYGLPYHFQKSFWSALVSHTRMLKYLGSNDDFSPTHMKVIK